MDFFSGIGQTSGFLSRGSIRGRFLILLTFFVFPVDASPGRTTFEFVLEQGRASESRLQFPGESCLLWEELP